MHGSTLRLAAARRQDDCLAYGSAVLLQLGLGEPAVREVECTGTKQERGVITKGFGEEVLVADAVDAHP